MKLLSCDNCAVILDQGKLNFPSNIWKYDGVSETIDESKADYNQYTKEWSAFVLCPVCNEKIFEYHYGDQVAKRYP